MNITAQNIFRFTIFLTILIFLSRSECESQISSFPYQESFESGSGGWTTGGVSSTWARGTPTTTIISGAPVGLNAWVTNLTGNYGPNELSTLTSPVFDFSSFLYPVVSFYVIYETERGWDGLGFQYSTNSGSTWLDFPSSGVSNCFRNNWYNLNSVTYNDFPMNNPGWSGNVTNIVGGGCANGGGSGTWLLATHCLYGLPSNLGGMNNVTFRFTFGSGGLCQDEGVGIDNFRIDSTVVAPDFSELCIGPLEVEFEASSAVPGCGLPYSDWNWKWYFGDPSSGPADSTTGWSASHVFTADGFYLIKMIATNPCGKTDSVTKVLYVSGIDCLLPLDEGNFSAKNCGWDVCLEWTGVFDEPDADYSLQRSDDASSWESLQSFSYGEGSGISANEVMHFTDRRPFISDQLYYRISSIDRNGEIHFTPIRRVRRSELFPTLTVYPNPVSIGEVVNIRMESVSTEFKKGDVQFSLTDITGHDIPISFEFQSENHFEMQTNAISPGLYILTSHSGGIRSHSRLIVQ